MKTEGWNMKCQIQNPHGKSPKLEDRPLGLWQQSSTDYIHNLVWFKGTIGVKYLESLVVTPILSSYFPFGILSSPLRGCSSLYLSSSFAPTPGLSHGSRTTTLTMSIVLEERVFMSISSINAKVGLKWTLSKRVPRCSWVTHYMPWLANANEGRSCQSFLWMFRNMYECLKHVVNFF